MAERAISIVKGTTMNLIDRVLERVIRTDERSGGSTDVYAASLPIVPETFPSTFRQQATEVLRQRRKARYERETLEGRQDPYNQMSQLLLRLPDPETADSTMSRFSNGALQSYYGRAFREVPLALSAIDALPKQEAWKLCDYVVEEQDRFRDMQGRQPTTLPLTVVLAELVRMRSHYDSGKVDVIALREHMASPEHAPLAAWYTEHHDGSQDHAA